MFNFRFKDWATQNARASQQLDIPSTTTAAALPAACSSPKRPKLPTQARKSRPLSASITSANRGYSNPACPRDKMLNVFHISAELISRGSHGQLFSSFSPTGLFGVPLAVVTSAADRRTAEEKERLRKEQMASRGSEHSAVLELFLKVDDIRRETNPFTTVLQLSPREEECYAVPVDIGTRQCECVRAPEDIELKSSMVVALDIMKARAASCRRTLTNGSNRVELREPIPLRDSSKQSPSSASAVSPLVPAPPPPLSLPVRPNQAVVQRQPVVSSLAMAADVYVHSPLFR